MTSTSSPSAAPTPAEFEIDHDHDVEAQQQKLADNIAAARDALRHALNAAEALTSGSAWHVDYAEGATGRDIIAFLTDAGRGLRAADALMPT